jgi:hypothetical protein
MKKFILSAMAVFAFVNMQGQEISPNALGLRLGDNDGFGGEISYQRGLSSNNRLELDLGWRNSNHVDAFKLSGIYQWVWNIENGFNWYAGPGAGIGSWNHDHNGVKDSGTFVFIGGQIGIEYNFNVPLQLSLDYRPEIYLNDGYRDGLGSDIALSIRYRF